MGPPSRAIFAGPTDIVIRIGPPAACVRLYTCHPGGWLRQRRRQTDAPGETRGAPSRCATHTIGCSCWPCAARRARETDEQRKAGEDPAVTSHHLPRASARVSPSLGEVARRRCRAEPAWGVVPSPPRARSRRRSAARLRAPPSTSMYGTFIRAPSATRYLSVSERASRCTRRPAS